jgi:hypothetical protein
MAADNDAQGRFMLGLVFLVVAAWSAACFFLGAWLL